MTADALPGLSLAGFAVERPVWGIDPAMKGVAVCALLPPGSFAASTAVWRWTDFMPLPPRIRSGERADRDARNRERRALYGERLASARRKTMLLVDELADRHPPAAVGVEQPFAAGRVIEPIQWFACGVVLEVVAARLPGVPVLPIEPMSWKARALGKGHGHAKKAEVMTWARREFAYVGSSEDEADAAGIAVATALGLSPA